MLTAHFTELVILAYKQGLKDPTFEDFVKARIHSVLGKRLTKHDGLPNQMEAKIREYALEIAEAAGFPLPLQKKPTLRRRFLNWLERG